MNKYYITTTLPYVNAPPHIGFALEIIQADVIARHKTLEEYEVFFNTGVDEHGLKIYRKAMESGIDTQIYCDKFAAMFDRLKKTLNLSYNHFIRTTDPRHIEAAQEFWRRCRNNGDIYKKNYRIKYCVGCELEKTESELLDGRCPIHPSIDIEAIDEENYFFRWSSYQKRLLEFYESRPDFVLPDHRYKEIKNFVEKGLEDFSISRLKKKMPWGIDVPDDDEHVMYVWFDALINYISTTGWPKDADCGNFWPGQQIAGKDNLRQQSAMWQAMLMSAGIPNSRQILIHGFITSGGQKMSKSLGNVVDPFSLVDKYGVDAVRYYLLSQIRTFEDGDFTIEKFEETFQSDLANGLGNLVARVAAMAKDEKLNPGGGTTDTAVVGHLNKYEFDMALGLIWQQARNADILINSERVWELTGKDRSDKLRILVESIRDIGCNLKPLLPSTAERILATFSGSEVVRGDNLFPRIK